MGKSNMKGHIIQKNKELGIPQIKQQYHTTTKTKKNAQYARKTRQRKKMLLNNLYSKYKQLEILNNQFQIQNKQLQIQNKQLRSKIELQQKNKDKQQQDHKKSSFSSLNQEYKKLNTACNNAETQVVQRCLDFLRNNYGVSGKERINMIQILLNKIVDIALPLHYKILMQNSHDSKKFRELLTCKYTFAGSRYSFNETQKQQLLNIRPMIMRQKQNYNNALKNLNRTRQIIIEQNQKCQQLIDNIQNKLQPIFVGKLLISLDSNRKQNYQDIYPNTYWAVLKQAKLSQPKNSEIQKLHELSYQLGQNQQHQYYNFGFDSNSY